jgi:hypothetical protein
MIDMTNAAIGSLWINCGDGPGKREVVEVYDSFYRHGRQTLAVRIIQSFHPDWIGEEYSVVENGKAYGSRDKDPHPWDIIAEFTFAECPY